MPEVEVDDPRVHDSGLGETLEKMVLLEHRVVDFENILNSILADLLHEFGSFSFLPLSLLVPGVIRATG